MTAKVMNQAEYARYRGVARKTITEYKHRGLLVLTEAGKVDVAASDANLDAFLDEVRGGDRTSEAAMPADANAYLEAKTREMRARAARQELETRKRAGELLERKSVERAAFTLARQTQEAVIAVADRLASVLAAESDAAKAHELLSDELRGVMNDMAKQAEELFA